MSIKKKPNPRKSKPKQTKEERNQIACLKVIKAALDKYKCELLIKPYPIAFITPDGNMPQRVDIGSKP